MGFYRRFQIMLLIDGAWVDITEDVQQTETISITRGGMDEQRRPTPAKCRFLIDNTSRDYSPRNPLSVYYGLLGRNTPVLVRVLLAEDLFSGSTSSGWGSADPVGIRDTNYAWTAVGGTGTDFNEAAGAATHLISAANSFRYTYLSDVAYRDVGVYAECTVAVSNVTGGAIEPANILLRGSGSTYYMVRVSVSTAEVLTVAFMTEAGVVVEAAVTVAGVVDAVSSKTVSVRAECEGEILRARVWKTGDPEPGMWHITGEDRTYLAAGWVGVRSGLAASNSNTPVTFSYNVIQVYSPQFAGEVAKWPQSRDTSGRDRTVAVEAWDVFQRLRQGTAALSSALRGGIEGLAVPAVAYWPCEDGRDATVVASDSPAGPMAITGTPDFATNDTFACSDPLPVLSGAAFFGVVPEYTPNNGESQVSLLIEFPATPDTDAQKITRVMTTGGTTGLWDVVYGNTFGGLLTLNVYNAAGALLHTNGPADFDMDGRPLRLSLDMNQNGADIAYTLATLDAIPGVTVGGFVSGTVTSQTYGRIDWINVGGDAVFVGLAVGHINVQDRITSIFALDDELNAFTGETAEDRIGRLAAEQGITAYVGTGSTDGQRMGPQLPGKFLALLEQCPEVDLGVLGSCRGEVAIRYDRLNYAYNQTANVVLDAANFELDDFEPVDDNFLTRNKITAKRINGSEYTATQTTGPLAAVDPIDGGVGVYDDAPNLNLYTDALLPDVAGYRLLQGTVDKPRFPDLSVDLRNLHVRAKEQTTRALIDLNLGERLQVEGASSSDLYDAVDLYVNGLTVTLSTFEHRVSPNCYSYDPYRIAEADSAEVRLTADTTLNEALDTTETGVDVTISDGSIWSDADGDFDITVGGERMTVTSISGASSPQTFTVGRSINGVVKSHSSGALVELADPHYLAGW